MSNQISSAAQNAQPMTAAAFSAKFKSKREIYLLLTLDARAYLPSHTNVTI